MIPCVNTLQDMQDKAEREILARERRLMGWKPIETAPRDSWILLGYTQQGDEMPHGLMVGVGMYHSGGKIWTMNAHDNEKALPAYWMPLPEPPAIESNEP